MKKLLSLAAFMCVTCSLFGQAFEVEGLLSNYHGIIGQTLKAPLIIHNKSEKAIVLCLRKVSGDIGSTQKNILCINNKCRDQRTEDFNFRLEKGQSFNSIALGVEAGLVETENVIRYVIFDRANPSDQLEFDLHFKIDEKFEKASIYASPQFILHDVYPNPVSDFAYINYTLFNDQVKASVRLHNILGNVIEEYPLPVSENRIKISAQVLDAGIYFYTIYLDNEAVVTQKLIVKK